VITSVTVVSPPVWAVLGTGAAFVGCAAAGASLAAWLLLLLTDIPLARRFALVDGWAEHLQERAHGVLRRCEYALAAATALVAASLIAWGVA